ncbi:MAG: septation protein IspZ [Termitinemataceae bacterium]|nr:MAG: septation protein IspZ [Termitinemataceae bacterium]
MFGGKKRQNTGLVLGIIVTLYPIIVFLSFFIFHAKLQHVSLFIILFAVIYFIFIRGNDNNKRKFLSFTSPVLLLAIGITCFFLKDPILLKLYPMLADIIYIIILVTSIFIPPTLVYYVINFLDKSIKKYVPANRLDSYCKNAAIVWCVFFVIDGVIAFFTAILKTEIQIFNMLISPDIVWGIYNAIITYIIMALIFICEFIIIKRMAKNGKNSMEAQNANS